MRRWPDYTGVIAAYVHAGTCTRIPKLGLGILAALFFFAFGLLAGLALTSGHKIIYLQYTCANYTNYKK